jgi:hypothetical protein
MARRIARVLLAAAAPEAIRGGGDRLNRKFTNNSEGEGQWSR